jgi:formylglycine-generating enzyme required for sulfatase activity
MHRDPSAALVVGRIAQPESVPGGAWGDVFEPLCCNSPLTRIGRTTPVGVFPEGDTPEGVSDLTGNVSEWTISLYGSGDGAEFRDPCRTADGRGDLRASSESRRVLRGGAWYKDPVLARSAFRNQLPPGAHHFDCGFRVVSS